MSDASQCPFAGSHKKHAAGEGTSNPDWWPNRLNLNIRDFDLSISPTHGLRQGQIGNTTVSRRSGQSLFKGYAVVSGHCGGSCRPGTWISALCIRARIAATVVA